MLPRSLRMIEGFGIHIAHRVAAGLGLEGVTDAPIPAAPVQALTFSPALQIIGKMKDTLVLVRTGISRPPNSER